VHTVMHQCSTTVTPWPIRLVIFGPFCTLVVNFCIPMEKNPKERRAASRAPASVPKEHPRAWNSALWDHVETIRALRRARKTWKEIGLHLEQAHGLRLAHRTIRNFYVRYTRRLRQQKFPAGYEPEALAPALQAKPEPPAPAGYEPDIYEQALEALKHKQLQQEPSKGVTHNPPGTII
jgi:hypothetical protein